MAELDKESRLEALRKELRNYAGGPLDAYIVPSEDAHHVILKGIPLLALLLWKMTFFSPFFNAE
jgi:hypothetical protein